MSISFSGLISGLDTSSWVDALVSVKQQKVTTLNTQLAGYQTKKTSLTTTRGAVSSLRASIEKLTDAKFGGTFDLFTKNSAESTNPEVFTATVTSAARRQDYDISVQQLATYTKATSKEAASAVADDSTSLKNIGITAGSLTVYLNGQKNTVNISSDDTLGDLRARVAAFGVNLNVDEDGVLHFTPADEENEIHIGATTDTSNLSSLLGLERQEDGTYASSNSLYKANILSNLTADDSGFNTQITEGTFVIGNATFTINGSTTLNSLINQINNSEEAQATAVWDNSTGKLTITSKVEGASYINIEAGTSNFTDVMGFTNSTWDEEGNVLASKMYTEAQELGKNALFTVNGTSMISSSNTVTSDLSRMEGVTLTLKRVNTEEDGTTTLKITQDTDELVSAMKSFVSSYNSFVSQIDEVTASGADLHGDTSLTSLKSTVRGFATGANTTNGGIYKLLSEIGVSTASADASSLDSDTNSLKFDEKKFMEALAENPDSVKKLLTDENGIFSMMENTLEQSLKASVGYFDVKTSTIDNDIKKMSEKITKQNKNIAAYK